jgi:hypothetical protein
MVQVKHMGNDEGIWNEKVPGFIPWGTKSIMQQSNN